MADLNSNGTGDPTERPNGSIRPAPPSRLRRAAVVLQPIKWVFALVALGFLALAAWDSRLVLADLTAEAVPSRIILALGFGLGIHLFAPLCSIAAIRFAGGTLSYPYTLNTHLRNLPGRYLPGGIWHTVGRAQTFLADGMNRRHLTALIILESAMPVGTGLTISTIALMLSRGLSQFQTSLIGAGLMGGIAILIAVPFIVSKVTRRSLAELAYRQYVILLLVYVGAWSLLAGMFTSYLFAFPKILPDSSFIVSAAIYIFSWAIGFIVVFAPQGIGVFELTAAYLLHDGFNLSAIVALVAGYRIIPLLCDIAGWAGFFLYHAFKKDKS